ncbi:MAG TPA: hypothetical protein VH593_17855 [Ktedonobacteraceae bacterium]
MATRIIAIQLLCNPIRDYQCTYNVLLYNENSLYELYLLAVDFFNGSDMDGGRSNGQSRSICHHPYHFHCSQLTRAG